MDMMHKVLVVDDTSYVRESIKILLDEKLIESAGAGNVKDAMAILKGDSKFDMVITDLKMPDVSGLEFISFIRDHYPSMPVLAISGGGNITQQNNLLSRAAKIANHTLKKPFTPEDFYSALEKTMRIPL
jgi:DNA-binding NtrC family response regulator